MYSLVKKMDKRIIEILAVVIVVAAGAAAAIVLTNNGNKGPAKDYSTIDVSTSLGVYGNDNNDALINDYDVDVINKIIAKEATLTDYPLADANNDGQVTSEDVDLVKKMMAHEACAVTVLALDNSAAQTAVKVNYPLKNAVLFGSNTNAVSLYIGAEKSIAGYFRQNYANFEAPLIANAQNLGGDAGDVTPGWAKFMALDTSLESSGGIGALIADVTRASGISDDQRADLSEAGIPLLFFASTDAKDEVSAALILGFLFGKETEQKSRDYATLSWQIFNKIKEITDTVTDKSSVISVTMGSKLAKNTSDNYDTIKAAGGVPYGEVNSSYKITSTKSLDNAGETLAPYDDVGYIISIRSVDKLVTATGIKDSYISTWDAYYDYFDDLDSYTELIYINNLLPGALKLAYILESLYPTAVAAGYADGLFTQMTEICSYLTGCTLDNTFTCMTYADYVAMGGTHTAA